MTPEQYQQLYDSAVVTKPTQAKAIADRISSPENKYAYGGVEQITHVPWYVVGIIHNMECSLNFKTHLHNGDSLKFRTTHVPAGRPLTGTPPFTWQESAIDALKMKGLDKVTDWSVPSILSHLEAYNGMGYAKRGVLSPYIFSGTDKYMKGKYTSDGHYDPEAVSSQIGVVAILKAIL